MDDRERALRLTFRDQQEVYARACLKIRAKSGAILPLRFNRPQQILHERLEAQRRVIRRVRALIVKARQQGISTYIAGRFYHQTTHRRGIRAYILTHLSQATDNLFEMVERFHAYSPALVKPHVGKSNAKELEFDLLASGYGVGTAGTAGVGRSATIQRFHGSEVAYWPNAQKHIDGVLQAVPGEDETEILLESTGNGKTGVFYLMVQAALRGENGYVVVFIPWWESEEYRGSAVLPEVWTAPPKWREYADLHRLDVEQLRWSYSKNAEMCGSIGASPDDGPCWKFRREYPATLSEAFQMASDETFIPADHVAKARRSMVEPTGALIIGVDPARAGKDSTGVIDRHGRRMGTILCERWRIADTMRVAAKLAELIQKHLPNAMNIDITGGLGAGIYDRLVDYGFGKVARAVTFASQADDPTRYVNKRAEMYDRMREWFAQPDLVTVQIPDDDELEADLTAAVWQSPEVPSGCRHLNDRLQFEAKESIIKRLGISTDLGDAAAMTFAFPTSHVLPDAPGRRVRVLSEFDPLA